MERTRKLASALTAILLPACTLFHSAGPPPRTPIAVRSHNARDVDVYLLCGEQDARWLGLVPPHGMADYEITPDQRRCAVGLNFFLMVRGRPRGYWVGPIRPDAASTVELVIEKYAPVSTASVLR